LIMFFAVEGGGTARAACPDYEPSPTPYSEELYRLRCEKEKLETALNLALTRLNPQWGGGFCDKGIDNDWNGHPMMLCGAGSGEIFEEAQFEIRAFGSKDVADAYWREWYQNHPDYDRSREEDDWAYYRKSAALSGLPAKEEAFGYGSSPDDSPRHIQGDLFFPYDNLFLHVGYIYRKDRDTLVRDLWYQASVLLASVAAADEPLGVRTELQIYIHPEIDAQCLLDVYVTMYGANEPTVSCFLSDGFHTAPQPFYHAGTDSLGYGIFRARYHYGSNCPITIFERPTLYTLETSVAKGSLAAADMLTVLAPEESPGDKHTYAVHGWAPLEPKPSGLWGLQPLDPVLFPGTEVFGMTGTGGGQVAVAVLDEIVTDFDGSLNLAVLSSPLFMGGTKTVQDHGTTWLKCNPGELPPFFETPAGISRASAQGVLDGMEYYGFFVSPLGTYRIVHHAEGVATPVVNWTQSDALTPGYGAWNQLRMVGAGGALKFYGNGELLHAIESPAFGQGVFALYATDSDDPQNPARVQFDHLAFIGTLAEPRVELEVQRTGAGSGMVTSTPAGISCGTDCRQFYKKNTVVTLSAVAATGSVFTGWGGACSGTAGCTFTMDGDKTVSAQFLPTGSVFEDFTDGTAQDWVDDGSGRWSVTGGVYVMAGNKGNAKRFALYDDLFCDVKFQADMRKTAGDDAGTRWTYGLHLRGDDEDNSYYSIVITTDGKYMIGKRVDGLFTVLAAWTASPALITGKGQWNNLTIEAVGDLLKFSANGTLLSTIEDDSLICGTLGLYAYDAASSDIPDRVEFDNIMIIPLDSGETRTLTVARTGEGTVTSNPSGISCGSACTASYPKEASVTLTAIPASGYDFAYYSGGCVSVNPVCSLTLATNTSVSARFVSKKSKKVNLVVMKTKTNKGDGTITSTDGRVTCGTDCRESYYPGSPVKLKVTAASGSVFTSWIGCPSAMGDTCTLAADKSMTVKAVFIGPYALKVQRVLKNKAGGTVTSADSKISCGMDCGESYIYNTTVALTATADSGSTFAGWTGCDAISGNTCTVTMNKAKTVRATFDKPKLR
jgi:hypothetical protein